MKVKALTPIRTKPGKAACEIGAIIDIDDEEVADLAAVGAVEKLAEEKPAKKAT
ncbi:MAG: hypothetical protein IPK59_04055 [Rhodospirillaceae bacterium]|nr:hypothetical protein [Rhodospirillaceae bacterium]